MLEFGQRFLEDDYASTLRLLLSTAAIAVPLFLALVVQRFLLLRGHQIERIEALGRLQDELRDYRRAIYGLASDLHTQALRKGIEIDLKRTLEDQREDRGFFDREHAILEHYIVAFWEFGSEHHRQAEFTKTAQLLSTSEFDRLWEAIEVCAGLFTRRKYYRHVLEPLGLAEARDWSNRLTTDGAHWYVSDSVGRGEDISTMAFWSRTVDDAFSIMERMRPLYWTLTARIPVRMLAYSIHLAGVGILVPLSLLAVDIPSVAEFYASYAALLLFGLGLVAGLVDLWRYLRTPLLQS